MQKNNEKSMVKAIQNGYVFIILICIFVWGLFFSYFMSGFMLKQTESSMEYSLTLTDLMIDYNKDLQQQIDELNEFILDKNSRITIIDLEGNVVADTSGSVDFNDNHNNREEIKDSMAGKESLAIRFSKTMKREMIYVAGYTQNNKYILRLALPYNGRIAFLKSFLPAISLGGLITVIIAFFIAKKTAKSITEPLSDISKEMTKIQSEGDDISLQKYKYSEINNIVNTVTTMSDRIERNMDRLRQEKNKINYILDNMKEGLIILDDKKNVMIINKAAFNFLEVPDNVRGNNILHYTQNMDIVDNITLAIEGGRESAFDIVNNKDKIIAVHITEVTKGTISGDENGAIVLMVDVSTERKGQRMRQEFFSNASHELKTPITSIQGYSELLVSNFNYREEQKKEFLNRIRKESIGMTVLINDILTISRLEAGVESDNPTEIDVRELIKGIQSATEPECRESDITLNIKCGDIFVIADYSKIHQLFNNLIVNAIRYNKVQGSVNVECSWQDNKLMLVVEDSGIGIPRESQDRVFERFYRIDKGRCKKEGGTGLGLAIVKHIVNFYGGSVVLTSKVDVGTKIEVNIPLKGAEKRK